MRFETDTNNLDVTILPNSTQFIIQIYGGTPYKEIFVESKEIGFTNERRIQEDSEEISSELDESDNEYAEDFMETTDSETASDLDVRLKL